MLIDGLNLVEGSENTNLVVTNVTEAQRAALTNVNAGEVVFVTNGTAPGLYTFDGTAWVPAKDDLSALATKTEVTTALALKADATALTSGLALKADATALTSGLALKADATALTSGLALKADATALTSGLALKADAATTYSKTEVDTAVALKADKSTTYTKTEADAKIASVVGAAPAALDTLQEIAAQLAADETAASALTTAVSLRAPINSPTFTGSVSGITKAMVGLGNVDNTADSAKPVSTAQQTALDLKANLASPTFTGTVSGITKAMVGLGNVDNTADSAKPVSTAQQTALDAKVGLTTVNTVTGRVQDSDGNLRSVPQSNKTNAYTLVAADNGKNINITTGGITIPSSVFQAGDIISIYNQSASAQNVAWSGPTVYASGTSTSKTSPLSLAARGVLTVMFVTATEILVSGNV